MWLSDFLSRLFLRWLRLLEQSFAPVARFLSQHSQPVSVMTGKDIVITGGARGIGRVLARYFLLNGHRVFILDNDEKELLYFLNTHLPAAVKKAGTGISLKGRVGYAVVNLRNAGAVHEAIRSAADFFGGRIDVLVNNAGIARAQWPNGKTMEDPSVLDEWAAYLETNLTGAFVTAQACIPYMKATDDFPKPGEQALHPDARASVNGKAVEARENPEARRSCIINISSFRAKQSEANCEGYAASKAGMLGLTHSMAMSGARWGIRVNAILPGYIEVQHETREGDEETRWPRWAYGVEESRHRDHPTGRIGQGVDIAKTIEWLMDAEFVTGQEIVVDGGVSIVKHPNA